jgi:hypothetical protein
MKAPSLGQAQGIMLLTAGALGLFVIYKLWSTGQSAAASVGQTFSSIGNAIGNAYHEVKGSIAQATDMRAGTPGPSGGGSRQELQVMQPEGPQVPESILIPGQVPRVPESVIPPWMMGASSDTLWSAYSIDSAGESLGTDDASAGVASPQLYSPDAMGLS